MNFANLKCGNGFINRQDVFNRLACFRCAEGEHLVMKRDGAFSDVGTTCAGDICVFFRVYTGTRYLYLYVRDMVREVANQLGSRFEADEWKKNETWTSEEALAALDEICKQ